jgi:hypothetical protein
MNIKIYNILVEITISVFFFSIKNTASKNKKNIDQIILGK